MFHLNNKVKTLKIPEIKMSWIFLFYLDLFSWVDYLREVWHIWKDNAVGKYFRICNRELPWGPRVPQISNLSPGVAILGELWGIGVCVLPKRSLFCAALWAEPKAIITKEHHFQAASPGPKTKMHSLQFPGHKWPMAVHVGHCSSSGLERRKRKTKYHLHQVLHQVQKLITCGSSDEHPHLLPVTRETFTSQTGHSSL